MTSKERVLQREWERGRAAARDLAARTVSESLTGTAIIAEEDHIPLWREDAVYTAGMIGWPVRHDGQVYTILQAHTPANNPGSYPKDLPAIYSIKHTTDPAKAKPYQPPNGTSGVYNMGDCCTEDGKTYRSKQNSNVWSPKEYPDWWEEVTDG